MCSPVHGLRIQRNKKKKLFISETTCYCKSNYSINVPVSGLVKKKLDFKKNEPKKGPILFLFYF